jgi:hypothetical protein
MRKMDFNSELKQGVYKKKEFFRSIHMEDL